MIFVKFYIKGGVFIKKSLLKKLFSLVLAAGTIFQVGILTINAEDKEKEASQHFVWYVDETDMKVSDKSLLSEYLNFSYEDILGFEECSSKILYFSTKHDVAHKKLSFNDEADTRFKASVETDLSFMDDYKENPTCKSVYECYLVYKDTFLRENTDITQFKTFYTYLSEVFPGYKNICLADEIFRKKVLNPILSEYCFNETVKFAVEEKNNEFLEELCVILKNNSELSTIPVSVKGIYTVLYEHYSDLLSGSYSTDIFRIMVCEYYDIRGRVLICEELNKFAEYSQFTEFCERFRYASTVDTMSRLKQSDIMSIASGIADYTVYYKENIRLKKMYYDLLCNDVYYQNGTYREADFSSDIKEFRETKTAMTAFYGEMYANYNGTIFSSDAINQDIIYYNNKAKAFNPKAKNSELLQYETQVMADGNAYVPIAIKEDNPVVVIVVVSVIVLGIIFGLLIVLKLAYYKLQDIPKPRW